MTFSERLSQLQSAVEALESEEIDLDSAVKKYGEAVKMGASLIKDIRTIDKKITILKKEADQLIEMDLS